MRTWRRRHSAARRPKDTPSRARNAAASSACGTPDRRRSAFSAPTTPPSSLSKLPSQSERRPARARGVLQTRRTRAAAEPYTPPPPWRAGLGAVRPRAAGQQPPPAPTSNHRRPTPGPRSPRRRPSPSPTSPRASAERRSSRDRAHASSAARLCASASAAATADATRPGAVPAVALVAAREACADVARVPRVTSSVSSRQRPGCTRASCPQPSAARPVHRLLAWPTWSQRLFNRPGLGPAGPSSPT